MTDPLVVHDSDVALERWSDAVRTPQGLAPGDAVTVEMTIRLSV